MFITDRKDSGKDRFQRGEGQGHQKLFKHVDFKMPVHFQGRDVKEEVGSLSPRLRREI